MFRKSVSLQIMSYNLVLTALWLSWQLAYLSRVPVARASRWIEQWDPKVLGLFWFILAKVHFEIQSLPGCRQCRCPKVSPI